MARTLPTGRACSSTASEGLQMADDGTTASRAVTPLVPGPHHVAYRTTRTNVTALFTARPGAVDRPVPACPAWTVRELVTHLADICASVGGGPPARRSGTDPHLTDLLADWARESERVETQLAMGRRGNSSVLIMDAFSHELDLRESLGDRPAPDDHPAYPIALDLVASGFSASVAAHRLPAVTIETDGGTWVAGPGRPVASVRAPRYEMLRSLTGRRSHDQLRTLDWSTDPKIWLPAFRWGPFTPPPG